jgi:hypothetical protein
MISRSQMNRQLYQMGGEGMQEGIMQMAPQEMQSQMQPMQDQSMQPQMQSMQAPLQDQGQPQMDPNQAIEILVRMLMEQGIPQEEAIKIAMQMIQAVSEGGMQEVSNDTRIEARFGGRIGYAGGGISRLVDREQYGFGSVFKSVGKVLKGATKAVTGVVKGVTSAVKKVASSDLGKLALMAAAIYAGGGGFGISPKGFSVMGSAGSPGLLGSGTFSLGKSVLGQQLLGSAPLYDAVGGGSAGLLKNIGIGTGYGANPFSGISSLIPGKSNLISGALGFAAGAATGAKPQDEEIDNSQRDAEVAEQYKNIRSNLTPPNYFPNNPFYSDYQYAANGGRIGYQEGGIGNVITQATQEAFFGQPQMPMMADGGRMNYSKGSDDKPVPISGDEFQKILEEFMKNQEKQEKIRRENKYNGGRMGYAMGNLVQQGIIAAPQIANQMGMPVGTPRMNEGGVPELDYRDEGGFVPPIGIKRESR